MVLHEYLIILRKRWMSILLITALTVAGDMTATLLATPTYQANSEVFVSMSTGGSTADLLSGSSFTQNEVTSYTAMVTSPRVLNPVIAQLGLATTTDQLAGSITADSPLNTDLIDITVTNVSGKLASEIANATAQSLGTQVSALVKPAGSQPSPVRVSTIQTASVPTAPASPNKKINLALGLLVGLILGFGLAFLREVLDTKVRTDADVQKVTNASVIARIGFDDDAPLHPVIMNSSPHSHRSEAFRRLRTNLQFLDIADRPKTIVVTSSLSGEGKSTTAVNLAITLADAGSKVALVDADLRLPSIAEYMGLEGAVGLTTVLIGQADLQTAMQPWGDHNLHVLTSGEVPPNPSELLGSRSMANLLEQLASQYDVVLIDTPPLLPVTDAAILAKITGGAVVIAAADKIHRQQLADGLGALEDVSARVLGVVLNRLAHKQNGGYSYYEYAYASAPATEAKGRTKARRSGWLGPRRRKHTRAASSDPAQTSTTHSRTRRVSHEADPNEAARIDREPVRVTSLPDDEL